MTAGDPKLAGVIGWPIEHSLSPLIHTIWAARAGVNGYYIPHAVPPNYDDFAAIMDGLRRVGFKGVNVTLPHKENALRYADNTSENATLAGAANMVTFGEDGSYADNSDIAGFAAAVAQKLGGALKLKSALILGAGGASRGVALALKSLGVTDLRIANRTREKAQTIANDVGASVVDWAARNETLADVELVANATSLGMTGQPPLEIDLAGASKDAIIADIVYAPLQTELLKAAVKQGFRTIDGLAMLMHQALPGFRAWFGAEAVVDDALRTELVRELSRRERME